jgi:putative transcriptional regulator
MPDGVGSKSLAPGFLVAVPQLLDPNFRQSVVLLLQQGGEGALGLVINRESTLSLCDLCRDHKIAYAGDPEKKVRVGGPVQPEQGLVLYGAEFEDPEGRPVLDGLQVSASTLTLSRLCDRSDVRFHCFSGYAGWGPGQLEKEIHEGSWILAPADASTVLDGSPDDAWMRVLRANGLDPASIVPGGGEVS